MKKPLIWTVIILIIIVGATYYWQIHQPATSVTPPIQNTQTQRFTSADQKLTFNYPSTLSVSQKNNIITLNHKINFTHSDACDFKGDAPMSPTLIDFNVTMQTFDMTIASTSKTVSPYIPAENYTGNTLKVSSGFIDAYTNGTWNGYSIYEGAEGCGQVTYYFPISNTKTLVIQQKWVGELSDVADPVQKQKILATPGVISPDQSTQIFNSIIQSLRAN